MKMIMPVKASAAGAITQTRGAGSIVSAGELLGTLALDDPSKVKKILPFKGDFTPTALGQASAAADDSLASKVNLALDGYVPVEGAATLVQRLFAETPRSAYNEVAGNILDRYLAV